jgi:carbamoyltransferase
MTAILGISAFYHDSAACLLVDGKLVAAAQEERFSRKKHDEGFPAGAIRYCLSEGKLNPEDLDYIGFYEKPLLKSDRLLETYLAFAPAGFKSFAKALPTWLHQKLRLTKELDRGLEGRYSGPYVFCDHHESHAASAFFLSPFDEAGILTMDGVGEWATATFGYGRGNTITLTHELRFPHSLGLLYSAFTYYTGFKVNSGEYKVMGLAPYGRPIFKGKILEHLIHLNTDGSFWMDMSYFNYCQGLTMTSEKFHALFGGPPRKAETRVTQREMDLAASVQDVTDEIMLRCARHVHQQTGSRYLVLAGGVALNCVANGRILREGPFDDIWIQPGAGDAGGAIGVASLIWHQLLDNPRRAVQGDSQSSSLLGPSTPDREICSLLDRMGVPYTYIEDEEELCDQVAERLAQEEVVGWFQGRMEFGPRALGNRSILGDPRNPKLQTVMNLKIKYRESFRPFAPAVLYEACKDYFELDRESPYMLLVAPVVESKRLLMTPEQEQLFGIEKLKVARSRIPAVTHVDYSARIQTVTQERNPTFHRLLLKFFHRSGCPVLVNTSFNVRGEPIVCTPLDAYRCFLRTEIDCLVMGKAILGRDAKDGMKLGIPAILAQPWETLAASSGKTGYDLVD